MRPRKLSSILAILALTILSVCKLGSCEDSFYKMRIYKKFIEDVF
jgi:hypothetical protein